MFKKIISVIILISVHCVLYGQNDQTSSAEKFNKRGIYNNGDVSFNGQEMISDYDGNLMLQYKTPLDFSNDMGDDLTIIYNSNVEHRVQRDFGDGYSINAPEWIIGFKGFALQTLNFETNIHISYQGNASGEEVPMLIGGYHYTRPMEGFFPYKDNIQILRADGSKLILENVAALQDTGLYMEKGLNVCGFANVQHSWTEPNVRTIDYEPGDGKIYHFEEERINLSGTTGPLMAVYLKKISTYNPNVEIEFKYEHLRDYNTNGYGRKVFTGISASNRASYGTWSTSIELEPIYIFQNGMFYVQIHNYNSDDYLNLEIDGYPSNIFTLQQSATDSRILMVSKIYDKLGRIDSFTYSDTSVVRKFTAGDPNTVYINYYFPLLTEYVTYSKKRINYTYYSQLFSGDSPDRRLDLRFPPYLIQDNIAYAERDCFTNFMLKEKNVYTSENNSYVQVLKEEYSYWKTGSNGSLGGSQSHEICSQKVITNFLPLPTGSEQVSIQSPKRILKNFSRYSLENILFAAMDASSTIKLDSEEEFLGLSDESKLSKKSFTYDIGVLRAFPDMPSQNYWNGTFTELSDTTKKFDVEGSSYTSVNYRASNELVFDSLRFFDGTHTYPIRVKKVLRSEKWHDPQTLITEKSYKNFLTNTTYSDIDPTNVWAYYHKIGLPAEEYIYSGGLTKLREKYEYFPSDDYNYGAKLRLTITNPIINPDTTSFTYYNIYDGIRIAGLVKNKSISKGLSQNYTYTNTSSETNDQSIQTTVQGYLTDTYNGKSLKTFTHNGFSLKPFSITTIFKNGNTLGTTISANNTKELPDFEIDLNGYYSLYKYDGMGRLTTAVLPGQFCLDCGQNVTVQDSMRVYYNDNATGTFPLTALEVKRFDVENTTQSMQTQLEYDSFGRLRKTSMKNDAGSFEEKSLKEYDYLGRVNKETTGGSYRVFNNYDAAGKPLKVINADDTHKNYTYNYGEGTISGKTYFVKIKLTDESGKEKTSYYDRAGNLVAEKLGNANPTIYEYDSIYRLTSVTTPEGITTTYQYDSSGNIIEKHSPDYGTYKYKYDRFNRLRFQFHTGAQELVFYQYDPLDRVLYIGVMNNYSEPQFNSLNANISSSFESNENNLVAVNMYDSFDRTGVFSAVPQQNQTPENLKGHLSASAYRDKPGGESKWNFKLYSYDYRGQIKNQLVTE